MAKSKTKRKKSTKRNMRRSGTRARAPAKKPVRRKIHRPRRVVRRVSDAKRSKPKRQMATSGALPLAGDNSVKGRRRLQLARRLGLKIR